MLADFPFKKITLRGKDASEDRKGAAETRSPAKRLVQLLELERRQTWQCRR